MEIFIDNILPITLRPWGRSVELATLPSLCAACLEIWGPQPPGILWVRNSPVQGLLYLLLNFTWDYRVRKFTSNKRFDNYSGHILSYGFLHSIRQHVCSDVLEDHEVSILRVKIWFRWILKSVNYAGRLQGFLPVTVIDILPLPKHLEPT